MSRARFQHAALLVACSVFLAIGALILADGVLRHARAVDASALRPSADDPATGLVYAGLALALDGPCKGGYQLPSSGLCTHGPDAAPPGVDVANGRAPAPLAAQTAAAAQCTDDGTSGYRTQVLYAHTDDSPNGDRYATYLASFRQWVAEADAIYDASAAETGGSRHIRFVTDSTCAVTVLAVTLSAVGDDNFDRTIGELQALGYNHPDRKYLVFMDANVLCGIGTLYGDDRPGVDNDNNGAYAGYARIDAPCWGPHSVAHEHMHMLGGVQDSAPHATGGGHCYDEYDVMCYADSPTAPSIRYLCADIGHEDRFDCNHDDYYGTNPASGSYLATHWNAANSRFLSATSQVATPSPTPAPSGNPTSATPSPLPSPAPATHQLTLQALPGGRIAPATSGAYPAGQTIAIQAFADPGYLFLGWTIDSTARGWANPLSLTVDSDHLVTATFAPRPHFGDLLAGDPAAEAIAQLAARGILRGYDPATVGAGDPMLRAQMAALIARAMGWSGAASAPFADRCAPAAPADCIDAELWGAVGQLADRDVARGYTDPTACGGQANTPCFAPRDDVLQAQVLSFITRAMVAQGYWQPQPIDPALYGGVLNGTGHEQDISTFVYYTRAFGGVPDFPASGAFPTWNRPATRAWFARAFWVALNSYWSVYRVP